MIRGGRQGGISLFDDVETAPISGNYWWGIKAGKKIPPALAIWGSEPREKGIPQPNKAVHYTVYPLFEMKMDTFKLHLKDFAVPMTKMFEVDEKVK